MQCSDNGERAEAEAIQITGIQRGGTARIKKAGTTGHANHGDTVEKQSGNNRESGSRCYTDNGDPKGGGTATIERAPAKALQITGFWEGRYGDNRKTEAEAIQLTRIDGGRRYSNNRESGSKRLHR